MPTLEFGDYEGSRYNTYSICIPSGQALYTRRLARNMEALYFTSKLARKGEVFEEVAQDFYHIGLPATANADLSVFDAAFKQRVATIAKGSGVEVIGWKPGFALLRSAIGLVGWVKLEAVSGFFTPDGFGHITSNVSLFDHEEY